MVYFVGNKVLNAGVCSGNTCAWIEHFIRAEKQELALVFAIYIIHLSQLFIFYICFTEQLHQLVEACLARFIVIIITLLNGVCECFCGASVTIGLG